MNTYSVIQKFDPVTDYFKDPYPHIIIKDCLPQQTYELLYENFPVQTIKDKFPLMEGHTRRGNANEFLGENKIEIKQKNSLYGPIQIKRIIPDGELAQLPIENLEVADTSSSAA